MHVVKTPRLCAARLFVWILVLALIRPLLFVRQTLAILNLWAEENSDPAQAHVQREGTQ